MLDDLLRVQLIRDEQLRLKMYKDTAVPPKWTIGVGRNIEDRGISKDEAELMLSNDIAICRNDLVQRLPWVIRLDEARLGVLLNMCFNMGVPRLLGFRRTLGLIQVGAYNEAATEMLNSAWSKQVGDRAKRLSKQMETGTWQ